MKITLKDVKKLKPCYNPRNIGAKDGVEYEVTQRGISEWAERCRNKSDIIWLLCREPYMNDSDMRHFAVWLSRRCMDKTDIGNPEREELETYFEIADKYADGEISEETLHLLIKTIRKRMVMAGHLLGWTNLFNAETVCTPTKPQIQSFIMMILERLENVDEELEKFKTYFNK
jgi:hypothetical protein